MVFEMFLLASPLPGKVFQTFYSFFPCWEIFLQWFLLDSPLPGNRFLIVFPCREKCFKIFYLLYPLLGLSYKIYSLFPCRENLFWNPFDCFAPLPGLCGIFGNVFLLVWFCCAFEYSLNAGWPDCVLCSLWDRKTLTLWYAIKLCLTVNMSLCFVVVLCPSGNIWGWVWLSERV